MLNFPRKMKTQRKKTNRIKFRLPNNQIEINFLKLSMHMQYSYCCYYQMNRCNHFSEGINHHTQVITYIYI